MHSVVKNVFIIIGTLVMSLLLFSLVFGDAGRGLIWEGVEPVYQANWRMNTYDDGALIGNQMTSTFNQTVEITE